ncbi:e3 ubiquitin-protein ligase [Gigaspora margarita]|uniref:E3 ubiquitin-protein ligase n=1 Tax=Gigaspora margarita TaxID=4874 RepID=A0A8H4ELH6_GIGMA|nr:e3 ubiquitin-protein ligase [Gigaspora margarita]
MSYFKKLIPKQPLNFGWSTSKKAQSTTKNKNVTTTLEDKYDKQDKELKEHTKLSQNEDDSDNENDEFHDAHDSIDIIEVTFHVHMPRNFDKSMQPLIVGNVEELGYWKRPKTKLHQIDINSTYWVSDPIKIYQKDYYDVEYKYAFYRPKDPQQQEFFSSLYDAYDSMFGDKTIEMEGNSEMDNRVLSSADNQYDIWKTNHSANLYSPSLNKDFRFINVIYESVTLENFKNKVMEFQSILKYQQTIHAIEMDSIYAHLSNSPNECQKILICVMLAYHIDSIQQKAINHFKLPENFPSTDLLKALNEVQSEDLLPSNAKKLFTNVTSALVRHNSSKSDLFDWMNMFAIAHIFDQDYMFVSNIKRHEYKDKDEIQHFYNLLKTNVKPHIDQIDRPLIYKRIIKAIINISFLRIESCDFLVNEIIGKENMSQEIREILGDAICKNLNSNNPCILEYYYKSLTEDLRVECASAFQKEFKKLMYNSGSTWNVKDSESMFQLFSQLFVSEPDIVEILDLLSKSTNLCLLQSFPKWLKSALELKDNIQLLNKNISSNSISSICDRWYSSIIDAIIQEGQNNIIIVMYKQLSAISFILEKKFDLYKRLLGIIEKRISNIPIDWFLQSTSFMGNLEPYIIKDFINVFTEKLNPLIGATDNKLITIIAQICDSSATSLNIPNLLCEDIICYILDIIHNRAKISGNFNISNDEQQSLLFKSSKFWIFLLNANGNVNKLHSHPHMKYVRFQISQLVYSIRDNSIQFGLLKTLFESENYEITSYFNAGQIDDETLITDDTLKFLRDKLNEHSDVIKQLYFFYDKYCEKTDDDQIYLDDLNQKNNALNFIPFSEILSQDYWSPHKMKIIEVSQYVFHYSESQIFTNIVEKNDAKDDEIQLSVSNVAETFTNNIIKQFQNTCLSYNNWRNIKCSEAQELWKGINKEQVKPELEIMASETSWQVQNDLIVSIEYLALIPDKIIQLEHLSKVLNDQFNVNNARESWVTIMEESLKNDDMKLSELSRFFQRLNNHLNEINESSWHVVKELSLANEFIEFLLKNLIGSNLTNFINAVDDQSDTKPLKEATVAALIEVNKALKPLNETAAKLSITEFLRRLREVSQNNPSLAGKISLCGSNNLALQNMHRNITNKGEVTKERIKNAATIGIYKFKHDEGLNTCELTMKYGTTQSQNENSSRIEKSYNMADLHDLYSRALLIGKSRTSTDQLFDDSTNNIRLHVNQFVIQMDLAQQIATIASRLIQSGHFLYQKICIEKHGSELQQTLNKLSHDLEVWKDVVNRAQNEHYYLTFFSARHILTFYDYFKSISNMRNHENNENNEFQASNREICQNLVRFINDAADLPEQTDVWSTVQNENDFLPVLRKIGVTLYNIFNGIERQVKSIPEDLELVVADTVYNGKLFVADCHSYSLVPNVILSLFVNHNSFPEAWQILICRNTTTEEEISLFIKRAFIAAKNGYKDYLFCIANVELLDFELQYHLVQSIRNFQDKEKDYLLALICTREKSINHHILEQFTENVHPTNGLGEGSMKILYSEICNNSVCVTSNMSGQGKTEWIKESSFKKGKVLRTLLISDKVNFETLVKKLANCKLDTFESLHIDISLITHPHDVNYFLFQLLTFGIIFNEMDIVNLPDTLFFIEIASTAGQYLLESLSLTKYIYHQHIEWDLKNLVVPHHINSPIQIVSYYMDADSRNALDNINIRLTGTEAIKDPLPAGRCQELLHQYFFSDQSNNVYSYRFLEIFVNVLADQLVRLSASSFFQVEQLKLMTRETKIRSSLFEILVSCSKEFATRAINTKDMQKVQKDNVQKENNQEVDRARLGNIVQWNDSNHLIVVFLSQMPNSICALYRDKTKVPRNVENLLKSQKAELQNYHKMESTMLLEILERLARRKMNKLDDLPEYALSIENLLKMAMILLRTRANIPVVCCGEAGCGKTSLISYLSKIMEVKFATLNFHAGIQESDISNSIKEAEKLANEDETWLFLDEINTCNHIGILGSLISHQIFNGKPIHPNIRIFAACNPYRLRTKTQSDVGLSAKMYEEKNKLVYQVHPLPDQILDYVWDYGYLKADDEKKYIDIMVKTKLGHSLFAELLYTSQAFIRNVEEPFSVSLRDVKRAIKLFKFFKKYNPSTKHITDPLEIRPMILALSLCYLFRLHNPSQRKLYREEIIAIIEKDPKYNKEPSKRQKHKQKQKIKDLFEENISKEQEMYTKKMQFPEGTALNEALLENILVMIVCVLTRIPVFIIGAPGSSKSLAVRIISMNLQGADSRDPYFRTLPQIYMIPFQGSASSTSEGIEKVFDTAKNYQDISSEENPVKAVVLLDEVGLAETSPHNPLKVLHALLEPPLGSKSSQPAVPVIGISNWRLDNSKSSRALLVQRPLFSEDDLVDTAKCLFGDSKIFKKVLSNFNTFLDTLAKAYLHYVEKQKYPNFHGLRDYYSLVKSIKNMNKEKLKENFYRNIQVALARNFGGTDNMDELFTIYFKAVLKPPNNLAYKYFPIPVQQLIDINFEEKGARNLMLIGNSNSIVSLQTYRLRRRDIEPVVIIGSQFPDDKDGDDIHMLFSIICVETGSPLILTDLELIYGSLYDLFNQNYLSEGSSSEDKKNFTRISLGPYSNPMLYVHPNFRCILVLDEEKLPYTDPPLLNRFEKQKLTLEETLSEREEKLFMSLKSWANQISTIFETSDNDTKYHFSEKDMFIGFSSEETLQSLVVDQCERNEDYNDDSIIDYCKKALISIATLDGIIRADKSFLKSSDSQEVKKWQSFYLQNRQHDSIQDFYRSLNDCLENDLAIINTFSNINTDVKLCLEEIDMNCQIDKLSTFKSEAELQNQIKRFYESDQDLYVLHCDSLTTNTGCIRLAKFIIEQHRNKFLDNTYQQNIQKRACIILHFNRQSGEENPNIFNFMCGWTQITIESLIAPEKSLSFLLNSTIGEILNGKISFEQILNQELRWCLLCMKHPSSKKSVEHIRQLIDEIPKCKKLVNSLKVRTEEWLQVNSSDKWQLNIALDKKFLSLYPSFYVALETYIRLLVRKPIAKLLYILDKYYAITPLFSWDDEDDLFKFWKQIFANNKIVNIDEVLTDPQPNLYDIPGNYLNLQFPFSYYFMEQIDQYKRLYQEGLDNLYEQPENLDNCDNLHPEVTKKFIENFSTNIQDTITTLTSEILQLARHLYFKDFIKICSANAGYLSEFDVQLLEFIFHRLCDNEILNDPVRLHIIWWDNSDAIVAELELARMCPSITELESNLPEDGDFGGYVINEIVNMMLEKIIVLKDEIIDELFIANYLSLWQRQVINVLSLCANIENSLESKILQFLRICNDLVSNQSINISDIVDTISLQLEPDPINILSQEFVGSALKLFDISATERNNTSQCSFFRRCFDIISIDSTVRIHLYEVLFGQEPRTFIGSVLSRVLLLEEDLQEGIFINLIKNPKAVFGRSPRLKAINTALQNSGIDSTIMALCCDVIQNDFFAEWTFQDLKNNFKEAFDVLYSTNFEPLQLVLAVALLKEFVNGFWISLESMQTIETEPITYDADIEEVIDKINHAMRRQSSLIHSFKLYFLRSLYDNGLSLHGIKCFCRIQSGIFQWLTDFNWVESNNKIGFIAYRCYDKYIEAEEAFTPLYSRGQQEQFENFLNQSSNNLTTSINMSIMGTLITHLYDIHAIRGLRTNEEIAIQCLKDKLPNMHFDKVYRDKLLSFLENNNPLYSIFQETSQTDLLIRSVIVHIIALHSCIPPSNSPLAAYLQTLTDCKNTYILASCIDIESEDVLGHFMSYECQCGYKYISGTVQKSNCPQCGSIAEGVQCIVNLGKRCKAAQGLNGGNERITQLGYVYESIESRKNINFCLRNLTPVPYRILHLFVHVLIAAAASSTDQWDVFTNPEQNNENQDHAMIEDPLDYCQQHIENDWQILTLLLDCDDETLAFILHSILHSMSESQIETTSRLDTVEKRQAWENEFTQLYINPKVTNALRTAADFKKLVKDSQHTLENEVNETLDVDENYQTNFYPRIWRRIGKPSLENLQTYCMGYPEFSTKFPFLSLFFEYQEQLTLVKNLIPIVKFTRMLSSRLCYRLKRDDALSLTFDRFLTNNEIQSRKSLEKAFQNFADAWNSVRENVQSKCYEFVNSMPEMTKDRPVVFALFEERNESLHLCRVIELLANLQNEFLQQVLAIGHGCSSLKFLGGQLIDDSDNTHPHQNYVESLFLSEAHAKNIISYTWNPKLLSFNQYGLEFGHGQEIQYELHKIEAELAYKLLYNKVYLKKHNDLLWLDVFQYHMELLSSSKTILREIRSLIPQEQISTDKLEFFTTTTSTSTTMGNSYHSLNTADMSLIFDNPTKLLSELEILLCFLKRTSGGDPEMEITKYYEWMKFSAITENLQFHQVVSGLKLKHVVALYELVEEKIADVEIRHLSHKYRANLPQQMKEEINAFVDFDKSHVVGRSSIKMSKIPHRIFELALKRFMFRYLSSELYDPDEKLAKYLSENCDKKHISDCWPFWVSNDVILDKFPKSLLVENIYNAYQYTIQNATKSNSQKTNNSFQNNNRQNKNQRNKTSNTTNTGTSSRTNRNRKRNEVDLV